MSSDSESSTSSHEYARRAHKKHKSEKKHKRKKDKKTKKRKRCKIESPKETRIATATTAIADREPLTDDAAFGPALPPHLLQRQTVESTQKVIGPIMPNDVSLQDAAMKVTKAENATTTVDNVEASNEHFYGPMPVTTETQMSAAQLQLEQRALELKLSAIDGSNNVSNDQTVREEWMLELPEVGLKTGLAALSNMKRTFHQGKSKPDFSDRSSWTKTPKDEAQAAKPKSLANSAETLKANAQLLYDRQRDEQQERMAKKHKKDKKRDESLVELHQKKLRKEQRKKEKELAASGAKAERRPFSRDVDLKLNKIDSNQTKKIVNQAKVLNTKFSSGQTKYL